MAVYAEPASGRLEGDKELTLAQMQDALLLMTETGIWDLKLREKLKNCTFSERGKFTLLDTEDCSFFYSDYRWKLLRKSLFPFEGVEEDIRDKVHQEMKKFAPDVVEKYVGGPLPAERGAAAYDAKFWSALRVFGLSPTSAVKQRLAIDVARIAAQPDAFTPRTRAATLSKFDAPQMPLEAVKEAAEAMAREKERQLLESILALRNVRQSIEEGKMYIGQNEKMRYTKPFEEMEIENRKYALQMMRKRRHELKNVLKAAGVVD